MIEEKNKQESLHLLSREIEQLIAERDDFLEITSLPTIDAYSALDRKIKAQMSLWMDALVIEIDPSSVRFLQGSLQAFKSLRETVRDAQDQSTIRTDEIAILTKQKDEILQEV